jgi:hypothetical protein
MHATKRTYWEVIEPLTRVESQTKSVLKAVSQLRKLDSAKLRQVIPGLYGDE